MAKPAGIAMRHAPTMARLEYQRCSTVRVGMPSDPDQWVGSNNQSKMEGIMPWLPSREPTA